jgi:hypothetical protein
MNPELEQRYMAMQANPAPPILSEVPQAELTSVEDEDADDDFELSVPAVRPQAAPKTPSPAPAQPPAQAEDSSPPQAESGNSAGSPASRPAAAENAVPHSVATGGDALLDIARQEEREVKKRQKSRRMIGGMKTPGGGLIIFCPYGCRVEVKEQHRGMTGKCPRCGAPFIVPTAPPRTKKPKTEGATTEGGAAPAQEKFRLWIHDLHLHVVDPEKLKIKADSLLKEFVEADVGFSSDVLLVAVLAKKGSAGLFAKGGGEKKESLRQSLITALNENKPVADLPLAEKYAFDAADLSQIKLIQPTLNRSESIFHGIPVFGAGRIAVQLPLTEKTPHPLYLSMGITELWAFSKALEEFYNIVGLAAQTGLPTSAETAMYKCHFSEMPIKALKNVEYFQADPTVQLEVAGYQCGACKTAVSEPARKKEKLGGSSPKGIAKAKCPKCGSKMGEHLLYSLKQDVSEPSMTGGS